MKQLLYVTVSYVYGTSFCIKEKMQIKGIYKVGAEENMAICGKNCKKYDESYIMKNFIIWTLHKYFWDDEIKKGDGQGM